MANKKNCSTAQIALAWVMQHDNVIPIPGTTKEKNLISNIQAQHIQLTEDELQSLNTLEKSMGDRYTTSSMRAYDLND